MWECECECRCPQRAEWEKTAFGEIRKQALLPAGSLGPEVQGQLPRFRNYDTEMCARQPPGSVCYSGWFEIQATVPRHWEVGILASAPLPASRIAPAEHGGRIALRKAGAGGSP